MEVEVVRRALHHLPFQPFRMRLADGRTMAVGHPDFIAVAPTGRTAVVYAADGSWSFVETLLIVSLDFDNNTQSSN